MAPRATPEWLTKRLKGVKGSGVDVPLHRHSCEGGHRRRRISTAMAGCG